MKRYAFLLLVLPSVLLGACGSSSGSSGGPLLGGTPGGTSPVPSGCGSSGSIVVCVAAGSTTLAADGTSTTTITATVTDGGNPVPDGQVVNFSTSLGSLSAASATTTAGDASVTFTAGNGAGTAIVTASFGGVDGTVSINLTALAAAGGIQFLSANPSVIGIQGGGQETTATATFQVTDQTGAPLPSVTVNFSMTGPVGASLANTSDVTGSNGQVSAILNSGTTAGPVTISATVTTTSGTFSTSSSVISIGGGIPSASHFTVVAEQLNLPGLEIAGVETTITVFLADRFSNFNILEGTSVSFYTEAGAIDRSQTVDDTGVASVQIRTQDPVPVDTAQLPQPQTDGWVTAIATVRGEESFADENGNGVFDGSDIFTPADDLGEPFIDADGSGSWDSGEFYVDDNANGVHDPANSVWDGPGCTAPCRQSPLIWTRIVIMFTGDIINCSLTPDSAANWSVANGSSQTFTFSVSDVNENYPLPGTTITVSASGGELQGQTSYTVPNAVSTQPFTRSVILADDDTDTTPEVVTVTLSVTGTESDVFTCDDVISTGDVL